MIYEYVCEKCNLITEKDFNIGKAKSTIKCSKCSDKIERYYGGMNFVLKGGGWVGKGKALNREMTSRNERAGKRMYKEHGSPMKTVAYDYGDGDVREVK